MPSRYKRAVWLLGSCQCALWGALYYSFSVLLVPMDSALGLSRTVVAGAFSAGLCAMAIMAPAVGQWLDAGHAARLTRSGSVLAVTGLLALALARGVAMLYLGWFCIGIAMAMLLYEPAFVLVIRAVKDERQRLWALAAVTVTGGLASTIFLPLLSVVADKWSWRTAVLVCSGTVLLAAWLMEKQVVPALPASSTAKPKTIQPHVSWPPKLTALAAIFSSGTLASMTLTTLLIPFLVERGVSASTAALVLAALGLAQIPGRIWLLRGGHSIPTSTMNIIPITFQIAGLMAVAATSVPAWASVGVAIFGLGAGLQTLTRPWLVQRLYGTVDAGRWNGEVARMQGFARAAGPVAAAGVAWLIGTRGAFIGAGALLMFTLWIAVRLPFEQATPLGGAGQTHPGQCEPGSFHGGLHP